MMTGNAYTYAFISIHLLLTNVLSSSDNISFYREINRLANDISMLYFQKYPCITLITTDLRNVQQVNVQRPIFIIHLWDKTNFSVEHLLWKSFEEGCGGYIVEAEAEKRSLIVKKLVSAKNRAVSYRYNTQRYLFLPTDENDTDAGVLRDPSMFFLPNFLFVRPNALGDFEKYRSFSIFTHTEFDPHKRNCLGEIYDLIDEWTFTGGFNKNADLYPDKIRDVKGKKIVLGLMHYVPYSLVISEGNRTIYDGLETRIAAGFVEKINGTWDGLDHPYEMWGTKFPNETGTGIYGSVQRHTADMGYSAIYQWYCDVLDCSQPYIQPEVICLVPKPQIFSGWFTILLPFTMSTWIAICIVFCISSFFLCTFYWQQNHLNNWQSKVTNISESRMAASIVSLACYSIYQIFGLQLQQVPKAAHKSNAVATFFKISVLYTFFVAVLWQGGVASFLTVPRYEETINTAQDLVSKWPRVTWGGIHNVWIYSIENSTDPILKSIVKKFTILDYDTLVEKSKTRNYAYFIEKLPHDHYGFNDYINEDTIPHLRLMENSIYTAFGVIILPRGSPYTEKLNHFINWIFDSGIVEKMENQVSLDRINNHLQSMIRFSNAKETTHVSLGLRHLEGPFALYLIGVFLSILLFLGEIFYTRSKFEHMKMF